MNIIQIHMKKEETKERIPCIVCDCAIWKTYTDGVKVCVDCGFMRNLPEISKDAKESPEATLAMSILLAEKNGFDFYQAFSEGNGLRQYFMEYARATLTDGDYYQLVFNHQFCQALFGEPWRGHMQEMVHDDNPIQYIQRFLCSLATKEE